MSDSSLWAYHAAFWANQAQIYAQQAAEAAQMAQETHSQQVRRVRRDVTNLRRSEQFAAARQYLGGIDREVAEEAMNPPLESKVDWQREGF